MFSIKKYSMITGKAGIKTKLTVLNVPTWALAQVDTWASKFLKNSKIGEQYMLQFSELLTSPKI